jgi:hypothetical protein
MDVFRLRGEPLSHRRKIAHKQEGRPHLKNVTETDDSCQVASGANLKYLEKGSITLNNEVTGVVKILKFDLYAALAAAKRKTRSMHPTFLTLTLLDITAVTCCVKRLEQCV